MGSASDIRAGGAVVELGANDISLKGQLDKAKANLDKFASYAATVSNKVATNLSIMANRAKNMGGILKNAFSMASKAASIFLAPIKLLGSGIMWVGEQAVSLASSLASIAWTQFKRGVLIATAALAAALKVFADFQTQVASVSTMLSGGAGTSGLRLDEFTAGLRKMSVEFGESTTTLAKGLYDILSASIPASEALDVLRASAIAAKAGMTDTGTAADVLTTILNAYGLAADKAGDVSDLLFTIVKRGKTTFNELASGIGMVATTASSAGVTLEEVGAALATMTRNGVKTDNAITALQAIISAFLKPTSEAVDTAKDMDRILRDLGVDTLALKKKLKAMGINVQTLGFEMNSATLKSEGLAGVFTRIASLPPDVLSKLFPNVRALRGVLPALQNMAGFTSDLAGMGDRAGASWEAFGKMTDTITHKFNQLKQGVLGVLSIIGETFAPVFEEALDILAGWVNGAREWFEEYDEDFRFYINDAWTAAKDIFKTAWDWINDNVISKIGTDFDTAFETVKTAATTFWEALKTIWNTGVSIIGKAIDIVKMFFEDPGHAGRMVADAFNEVWEIAAGAIDFARGSTLLDKLADFFGGLVARLRETGFVDKIVDLIAGVFAINNKLWAVILEWALALGAAIYDAVYDAVAGGIKDALGLGGGLFSEEAISLLGKSRIGVPMAAPTGAAPSVALPPRPPTAIPGDVYSYPNRSATKGGGITQNVTINARNPLDPNVTEGIQLNLGRLKNRGR